MARPPAQGRQERNQISAWEELPGPHATNPPTSLRDVEKFLKDVLKDVGKRGASPERRCGIKKIIIIYNYSLYGTSFRKSPTFTNVFQDVFQESLNVSQGSMWVSSKWARKLLPSRYLDPFGRGHSYQSIYRCKNKMHGTTQQLHTHGLAFFLQLAASLSRSAKAPPAQISTLSQEA